MCGIFGYVTNNGSGPCIAELRRIARETEARGNHAWGLAWVDQEGNLWTKKAAGPISRVIYEIDEVEGAVAVIGHCRYATHGDPADNANNHPHKAGRGLFVHNGVVFNYDELILQYNMELETECDTEVIGHLIERAGGGLAKRIEFAASKVEGPMAILGLWTNPVRLAVARFGNPLHYTKRSDGFYFASSPWALSGNARPVKEDRVMVMRLQTSNLYATVNN